MSKYKTEEYKELKKEYPIFLKALKTTDVIDIKNNYNIQWLNETTKDTKDLKLFVKQESEHLQPEEIKKYISHDIDSHPNLLFISKDYVIKYDTGDFLFFDHNIKFLFSYVAFNDGNKLKIPQFFNNFVNYYHFDYDQEYTIHISKKVSISKIEKNKFELQMADKYAIKTIDFQKDTIHVRFAESFYNKIILDYSFNILSIDFHASIKKMLNITSSFKNIKDYNDMLDRLVDSFEYYFLINDKSFNLKLKEKNFNDHIKIIKMLTHNKTQIETLFSNTKKEIESIIPTQHIGINYDYYFKNDFPDDLEDEYYSITHFDKKFKSNIAILYRAVGTLLDLQKNKINPIDFPTIQKMIDLSKRTELTIKNFKK